MTTYINDFTGIEGSDITNENSGAGGTAFNETNMPQVGSGASLVYSTSHGFTAMLAIGAPTSTVARRGWQVNPEGASTDQYAVFYFDRSDFTVGTNFFPIRAMSEDSSAQRMRIQITSNGSLQLRDAANSNVWNPATQLSPGVRYRIEVMWGATVSSSGQVKIFEEEGTTPVIDSGLLTGLNFGGPTQSMWFGLTAATTSTTAKLIRRVGWSDSTWIGPYSETAEAFLDVHLGTGVPGNKSVRVSQRWVNAGTFPIRLVLSTSSNLSNPLYGATTTVDDKGWVQLTATGLSPNTLYFGGVEINGALSSAGRFSFRTAPFDGDGVSHSILFGAGRQVNGGEEAFAAMKSLVDLAAALEGRPVFLADMGDNSYPNWQDGTTEDHVLDRLASQAKYSTIPDTMAVLPWAFSLGDSDSPRVSEVKDAYRRAVPTSTLPSSSALYRTFDWGRVRYIIPDNWSERTPVADPDGPDKRMWSQTQEDWFISQVESWPWVICVLGGLSCRQIGGSSDGWSAYATQFNRIHDRLNAIDSLRRLVWLSAHRSALAADLGISAGTRGVAQVVAGPFDANSVDLPTGEQWSAGYYNVTPNAPMTAFGEASFSDSGGNIIVFTYYGLTQDGFSKVEMTKQLDVAPRVLWRKPEGY